MSQLESADNGQNNNKVFHFFFKFRWTVQSKTNDKTEKNVDYIPTKFAKSYLQTKIVLLRRVLIDKVHCLFFKFQDWNKQPWEDDRGFLVKFQLSFIIVIMTFLFIIQKFSYKTEQFLWVKKEQSGSFHKCWIMNFQIIKFFFWIELLIESYFVCQYFI
jgi:hypothetical protein